MQPQWHIRLFGDFSVSFGDEPITYLNTPRVQTLLTYLLLHRDAPQARQHIAFLFWPDSSEEQALSNLRNLLFSLRRALPSLAHYLKADRNVLQWQEGSALEIDVLQFEHDLAEAERAAREANIRAQQDFLQRAIELYRGDLLPGSYDDWILVERERLQQRFTSALESLITLLEREGNVHGAIDASQRLLRHNPLHEAIYKRLIDLYAANDMVPEALRIYHTCATTLDRELGVEPSANTREAYERLLNSPRVPGKPRRALGAHTDRTVPQGDRTVPQGPAPSSKSQAPALSPQFPALRVGTPLAGRAPEWALLQEAWREVAMPKEGDELSVRPHVVLIRGEAGIGKTRLVEELFNWVARQGVASASARCYPIERRLAFGPVADWLDLLSVRPLSPVWLSEIARLRPGILAEYPGIPAPGPLTEAWQRRRFMEALAHLLDGLRDTNQLLEVDLMPLDLEDTATLAATLSGGQVLDSPRISELHRETEGNPLFIVEMLRTGWLVRMRNVEFGIRNKDEPAPEGTPYIPNSEFHIPHSEGLPPRIAGVLKTRLAQVSPKARDLIDLASVIGRDFTLPLLQLASNENENVVVSAMDELWRRRIVREQGEDGYDFSHDKIRQVAYSMLTMAKRRMLHGRVAHALEEVYASRLELVSAQLGVHYEMAGSLLLAARYYRRAAEDARQLYANTEAISLYERAFALVQRATAQAASNAPNDGNELMVEVGESLADLLEITGNHVKARSSYEKALACFSAPSFVLRRPLSNARLLLKIGDTWRAQREFHTAIEYYDTFDRVLGDEPSPSIFAEGPETARTPGTYGARTHEDWWDLRIESTVARLMVHYWQSAPVEMQKIVERMQPALERHGTRMQKVKYYRCLATMHLRLDLYNTSDECLRYVMAALDETLALNSLTELADTTFLMGFCLLWRGLDQPKARDLSSAVDHLRQALSLTERTGQADYQLLSLVYLTIAYRMQGDVQRTRETIARHLAYRDLVQMPAYSQIAEANLAWVAWNEGDLGAAERHAMTALPFFSEGESFAWLVIWPLVAACLAQDRLADAVRFANAQLAPHIQRAPTDLLVAVKSAAEAWDMQHNDLALSHLQDALRLAHECNYI